MVSSQGLYIIARLAVLAPARRLTATIEVGKPVIWWSEVFAARLNKINSVQSPIIYHKPRSDANPSYAHTIDEHDNRTYPNPDYLFGEVVVGKTKSHPARLPNHISRFRDQPHSRGYVSVSKIGDQWTSKYWPEICLTPESVVLCNSLLVYNRISAMSLPEESLHTFLQWTLMSRHPENYAQAFVMP